MKIVICCNLSIDEKMFDNSQIISSGSWICSYLYKLHKSQNDELLIFCPKHSVKKNDFELKTAGKHKICYFSKQNEDYIREDEHLVRIFLNLLKDFKPDIVHIFGTEFPHSFSLFCACKKCEMENKVVVNLQGFVSEIAKHYFEGIPEKLLDSMTLRDFVLKTSIRKQKKNYERLSVPEIKLLRSVSNVIGRTEWDYNVSKSINNDVNYYDCTELIRQSFFNHSWEISKINRYTIFMSQASYPVKGLHYMIPALANVKKIYPETKLFIAGPNIFKRPFYKDSTYIRYLKEKAKELNVYESITFLGTLDHESMARQYLSSHVFVVCSQIENESNAFSEATICGVPCVCAQVGGMKSRIMNGVNCIGFESGDIEGLTNGIINVFSNDSYAVKLSNGAKVYAKEKFDNEENYIKIRNAYMDIIERKV